MADAEVSDVDWGHNVLAAGGLVGSLLAATIARPELRIQVEGVVDEAGLATNVVRIHLPFLRSWYRATIEREPDEPKGVVVEVRVAGSEPER